MTYRQQIGGRTYVFESLIDVLAKAGPARSGDELAGCAAESDAERAAAKWVLADIPLAVFLNEPVVPYETDDVTRLIIDTHDRAAFAPIARMTVGEFRDWLLTEVASGTAEFTIPALARGLTPEMAAAVSKLMRNQDLITVARVLSPQAAFRTTIGATGRLATRLQPNHPTDDPRGIAAGILDGLLLGCGDAVVGINPASDDPVAIARLLHLLDDVRLRFDIPMQSCVLTHATTTLELIEQGVPVDLVFQSIAGTQAANTGFGITLDLLAETAAAAGELGRGTVGRNVMYFETGQGSALSADAHRGMGGQAVDQQTLEARAYGVARAFDPLLVNTVVGFIGPEYLYNGKQITRAGLEDNFCGKLLGLPMGVDVCYTNHAEADGDDMDLLATALAVAGTAFMITVPGSDDTMLGYQSLSFHDALYLRRVCGLRPAPEFEAWLQRMDMADDRGRVLPAGPAGSPLRALAANR